MASSGVIFELDAAACGDGIPPKLQQLIARHPIPLSGGRESVEQDKLMICCRGRGCSHILSTDPFHRLATSFVASLAGRHKLCHGASHTTDSVKSRRMCLYK